MSMQEAQRFFAAIAADPELASKATASLQGKKPAEAMQALSELAKSAGYDLKAEDLMPQRQHEQPLPDEVLNSVAGGSVIGTAPQDLQQMGQFFQPAGSGPMTPFLSAANDEVSAAIAQMFSLQAQAYQQISSQAAAFHNEFVNLFNSAAGSYNNP